MQDQPTPTKSTIRILHVIDKLSVDGSKIHGPARQISYRVPLYDPERYAVRIINLRQDDPAAELMREKGLEVISLGRSKFDLGAIRDIRKQVRDFKPDVLHLHGYAAWNFGRVVGRMTGTPVLVQEHFIDEKVPLIQRLADRLLSGRDDRALAVSLAVKGFMEQRGVTTPIDVVWNAVPEGAAKLLADADLTALRAEHGIGPEQTVVGIVGRLAEMKGHRYLIDAVHSLVQQGRDLTLLIVGEGPTREALTRQVESLGLSERVRFAGYRSDGVCQLALCNVCVVASVFGEGFCSVGIETFLAGRPLVITDLPAFEGLYVDEQNVLMVPPRDAQALAGAIGRVLDDPALRQRLLAGGRETLKACRMEIIADQYLETYEGMVAEGGVD